MDTLLQWAPILSAIAACFSAIAVCVFSWQSHQLQKQTDKRDSQRLYFEQADRIFSLVVAFIELLGTINAYIAYDKFLFKHFEEQLTRKYEKASKSYAENSCFLLPDDRNQLNQILKQVHRAKYDYAQTSNEAAAKKTLIQTSIDGALVNELFKKFLYIEKQNFS